MPRKGRKRSINGPKHKKFLAANDSTQESESEEHCVPKMKDSKENLHKRVKANQVSQVEDNREMDTHSFESSALPKELSAENERLKLLVKEINDLNEFLQRQNNGYVQKLSDGMQESYKAELEKESLAQQVEYLKRKNQSYIEDISLLSSRVKQLEISLAHSISREHTHSVEHSKLSPSEKDLSLKEKNAAEGKDLEILHTIITEKESANEELKNNVKQNWALLIKFGKKLNEKGLLDEEDSISLSNQYKNQSYAIENFQPEDHEMFEDILNFSSKASDLSKNFDEDEAAKNNSTQNTPSSNTKNTVVSKDLLDIDSNASSTGNKPVSSGSNSQIHHKKDSSYSEKNFNTQCGRSRVFHEQNILSDHEMFEDNGSISSRSSEVSEKSFKDKCAENFLQINAKNSSTPYAALKNLTDHVSKDLAKAGSNISSTNNKPVSCDDISPIRLQNDLKYVGKKVKKPISRKRRNILHSKRFKRCMAFSSNDEFSDSELSDICSNEVTELIAIESQLDSKVGFIEELDLPECFVVLERLPSNVDSHTPTLLKDIENEEGFDPNLQDLRNIADNLEIAPEKKLYSRFDVRNSFHLKKFGAVNTESIPESTSDCKVIDNSEKRTSTSSNCDNAVSESPKKYIPSQKSGKQVSQVLNSELKSMWKSWINESKRDSTSEKFLVLEENGKQKTHVHSIQFGLEDKAPSENIESSEDTQTNKKVPSFGSSDSIDKLIDEMSNNALRVDESKSNKEVPDEVFSDESDSDNSCMDVSEQHFVKDKSKTPKTCVNTISFNRVSGWKENISELSKVKEPETKSQFAVNRYSQANIEQASKCLIKENDLSIISKDHQDKNLDKAVEEISSLSSLLPSEQEDEITEQVSSEHVLNIERNSNSIDKMLIASESFECEDSEDSSKLKNSSENTSLKWSNWINKRNNSSTPGMLLIQEKCKSSEAPSVSSGQCELTDEFSSKDVEISDKEYVELVKKKIFDENSYEGIIIKKSQSVKEVPDEALSDDNSSSEFPDSNSDVENIPRSPKPCLEFFTQEISNKSSIVELESDNPPDKSLVQTAGAILSLQSPLSPDSENDVVKDKLNSKCVEIDLMHDCLTLNASIPESESLVLDEHESDRKNSDTNLGCMIKENEDCDLAGFKENLRFKCSNSKNSMMTEDFSISDSVVQSILVDQSSPSNSIDLPEFLESNFAFTNQTKAEESNLLNRSMNLVSGSLIHKEDLDISFENSLTSDFVNNPKALSSTPKLPFQKTPIKRKISHESLISSELLHEHPAKILKVSGTDASTKKLNANKIIEIHSDHPLFSKAPPHDNLDQESAVVKDTSIQLSTSLANEAEHLSFNSELNAKDHSQLVENFGASNQSTLRNVGKDNLIANKKESLPLLNLLNKLWSKKTANPKEKNKVDKSSCVDKSDHPSFLSMSSEEVKDEDKFLPDTASISDTWANNLDISSDEDALVISLEDDEVIDEHTPTKETNPSNQNSNIISDEDSLVMVCNTEEGNNNQSPKYETRRVTSPSIFSSDQLSQMLNKEVKNINYLPSDPTGASVSYVNDLDISSDDEALVIACDEVKNENTLKKDIIMTSTVNDNQLSLQSNEEVKNIDDMLSDPTGISVTDVNDLDISSDDEALVMACDTEEVRNQHILKKDIRMTSPVDNSCIATDFKPVDSQSVSAGNSFGESFLTKTGNVQLSGSGNKTLEATTSLPKLKLLNNLIKSAPLKKGSLLNSFTKSLKKTCVSQTNSNSNPADDDEGNFEIKGRKMFKNLGGNPSDTSNPYQIPFQRRSTRFNSQRTIFPPKPKSPEGYMSIQMDNLYNFEDIFKQVVKFRHTGIYNTKIEDQLFHKFKSIIPSRELLLHYIFYYLQRYRHNPFLQDIKDGEVLLSQDELCFINILFRLDKTVIPHFRNITEVAVQTLSHILLSKSLITLYTLGGICRVFTGICKRLNDPEKALTFCSEVLKMRHKNSLFYISCVAGVWKEVLQVQESMSDEEKALCYAISYGTKKNLRSFLRNYPQSIGNIQSFIDKTLTTPRNFDRPTLLSVAHSLEEHLKNDRKTRKQVISDTCAGLSREEELIVSSLIIFAVHSRNKSAVIKRYIRPNLKKYESEENFKSFKVYSDIYVYIKSRCPNDVKEDLLTEMFEKTLHMKGSHFHDIAAVGLIKFYLDKNQGNIPPNLQSWLKENKMNPVAEPILLLLRRKKYSTLKSLTPNDIFIP